MFVLAEISILSLRFPARFVDQTALFGKGSSGLAPRCCEPRRTGSVWRVAARDLATPLRLRSGLGSICAFVASIRIRPCQSIPFNASGAFTQCVTRNNEVALGRLLFDSRDGARAKLGDKISQCLRTSGIGYDYGMTSVYQMAAERTGYVAGTDKSYFLDESPFFG
jgi:hypothetical protein